MLAYLFWNPTGVCCSLPLVGLDVRWYGVCFAVGFYGAVRWAQLFVSRACCATTLERKRDLRDMIEKVSLWLFVGLLVGARVGHIVFYDDLSHFVQHPFHILYLWQGGLASHGAICGALLALWYFWCCSRTPSYLHAKDLLDVLAVASSWMGGCIRVGNFLNQEITGVVTSVPWAVVFGAPLDASGGVPRHPVQLYEAGFFFVFFASSWVFSRYYDVMQRGLLAGVFLLLTFAWRMWVETLKSPQCSFDYGSWHMGQVLSIPFVCLGGYLVFSAWSSRKTLDS